MQSIRQKSLSPFVQFPLEFADVLCGHHELDQFVQQGAVSFPEAVYALGVTKWYAFS